MLFLTIHAPTLSPTAPVDASQAPPVVWTSISAIFDRKAQEAKA